MPSPRCASACRKHRSSQGESSPFVGENGSSGVRRSIEEGKNGEPTSDADQGDVVRDTVDPKPGTPPAVTAGSQKRRLAGGLRRCDDG